MTTEPSSPPRDAPVALQTGATIGRYVVLTMVGRGAMGDVYAAYDPELDRKIAIKLLRPTSGAVAGVSEGRLRLLREAQAIARLSHPNVIVVHDVGTFEDRVFVAMEFVEGHTLGYWLQQKTRSWREIRRMFLAAGRGLAAAHDAGLVHRDFKPENVMVGADGQLRVMDFGLARQVVTGRADQALAAATGRATPTDAVAEVPPDADPTATTVLGASGSRAPGHLAGISGSTVSGAFAAELTQAGSLVGTPAYMSPEQFSGAPTDARTDQFSFCVALWEALYGRRPFDGKTLFGLVANVMQGRVVDPPPHSRVPPWVRKVLLRGLASKADERFPSMAALLAALENDPGVRRRKWLVAAGIASAVVLVGGAIAGGVRAQRAVCRGAGERLAGVWSLGQDEKTSPRRAAIQRAFLRSGRAYATETYGLVVRILDRYAADWAATYTDACEATQVRGEQSADVLDLRMTCLRERLGELKALTDVLVTANAAVVDKAASAASSLGRISRCDDVALLRAVVGPPEDPAVKARVDALSQELPRVKALVDSGQCAPALSRGRALAADAEAVGYSRSRAEAMNLLGFVEGECGDVRAAEAAYKNAVWAAEEAHHDELKAEAASQLVTIFGDRVARPDLGHDWARQAEATLRRIGGNVRLEAWLLHSTGLLFFGQRRWADALDRFQKSLDIRIRILAPDDPDLARAWATLGLALNELGRRDEALADNDRALALAERTLGRAHPLLALILSNQGEVLHALGRYEEARAAYRRALEIYRGAGTDLFYTSFPLTGLGRALVAEHREAEAIPHLERALAIREQGDPDQLRVAETRFALAQALWPTSPERALTLAALAERTFSAAASDSTQARTVAAWVATRRHRR